MKKLFKHKILSIFLSIILSCVLFMLAINVIPPKKVIAENPFIIEKGAKPLIAAHRGGKNLNPENTFKAINYSYNQYHIDILEMDVCLTKDGHLVLNHDLSIKKATGQNLLISTLKLENLQKFNFGYNFQDKSGAYPYRNILDGVSDENKSQVLLENELRVVSLEELFNVYKDKDIKFIIEIKNSDDAGITATDTLVRLIKENGLEKRVVVGTFHDEVESHLKKSYPEIMRGASTSVAKKFVITQIARVNLFDDSDFAALQVPISYTLKNIDIDLSAKHLINRAHRRNISVQYWTINEKEEMRRLIELGADVIMTDNPDVMYELLVEMGYYK